MIFVITGTQLPFDRLIKIIDEWAGDNNVEDIIAQTGDGLYRPKYVKSYNFISPNDFLEYQRSSDFIIGHAGMGTILSSLELGKPILIFPRQMCYSEHRNDHQLATANKFKNKPGVNVAFEKEDLLFYLNNKEKISSPQGNLSASAGEDILSAIRFFINN